MQQDNEEDNTQNEQTSGQYQQKGKGCVEITITILLTLLGIAAFIFGACFIAVSRF